MKSVAKFLRFLAFAVLTLAAPLPEKEDEAAAPLVIELERRDNTNFTAYVRNTGDKDLRLLKTGTFLGDSPTQKAYVVDNGEYNFTGLDDE